MLSMTKTLFALLFFAGVTLNLSAKHHKGGHQGMKGLMHTKMLEKIDTDKDGKISKQEWQAHHDERFAELDADKDGAISQEEFKAHHQKMMKQHQAKMGNQSDRPVKGKKPRRKNKMHNDEEPGQPADE
jgi:hypothetical protein